MFAKDLIEILKKLPEDTIICKTLGEDCCADLNSAKYFPQYNILYLTQFWDRRSRGFIDMADGDAVFFGGHEGSPHCPFSKEELTTIRDLARKGKIMVNEKADGKMHRIQVVWTFAVCEDMCNGFALKVDGEYAGGQRGEGIKQVICDFEWESLSAEVQ